MGKKNVVGTGRYSERTYAEAVRLGAAILTSRGTKGKPRKMHRNNLLDWVQNEKAVDETKQTLIDPRNLNPYRGRCYGAIVDALLSKLPAHEAKELTGSFTNDFGRIREWSGKIDKETEAVLCTPWLSARALFDLACSQTKGLRRMLAERKSTRPGVKKANRITSPFVKFVKNVEVLQRTGGVTPYALPLMKSLFAIDHRWVVGSNGKPELQYRLAVGRSEPQKSGKRDIAEVAAPKKVRKPKAKTQAAPVEVVKEEELVTA